MIKLGLFQECKDSLIYTNQSKCDIPYQQIKRKIQTNIPDEHRCKNPQQNFSKQNSATHQKVHTP